MERNVYIRTLRSPSPHQISPEATKRKHQIQSIRLSIKEHPMIKTHIQRRHSLSQSPVKGKPKSNNNLEDPNQMDLDSCGTFQDRFELLQKLGGSSALIFRCRLKLTGKQFAVKVFSFQNEQLLGLKSNFLDVKRLSHHNILKYKALYTNEVKRRGWLVMQFVACSSLERYHPKSETQLKKIFTQLLNAVSYLHQKGMTHRNIKPSSVLFDPDSERIKLVGLVPAKKNFKRGVSNDMLTRTGNFYYMAPQMLEGGGYQESVDIWAVGILLFKIIAGYTPFESLYYQQTVKGITSSELTFPPCFQNYSQALRGFVKKLLEKDKKLRYCASESLQDEWLMDKFKFQDEDKDKQVPFLVHHSSEGGLP